MHWRTLTVLTAILLVAGGSNDDEAKRELRTFQGTWVLVSAEKGGKKLAQDKGIKLQIEENKYALTQQSSAVIGHRGTFTLDPSKNPKTTVVNVTEGPDKGKSFLGIYQLSSDDYTVCFAPPGKERPKDFSSASGSGNLLQLWKREKK